MKQRKRDILGYLWIVAATFCALCAVSANRALSVLTTAHYEIQTQLKQPLRIVQLTDLHGHSFGENNAALCALAADQKPDLIALTGDMLDGEDENAAVVCGLIRKLREVAPVYFCYGNHEKSWEERTGKSLKPELEAAGAVVLDAAFQDITIRGQSLRIGGFDGYYRYWGMRAKDKAQAEAEEAFADAFEDTERFKLLLNHIPTVWTDWGNIHKFPVDLVLSGHYHGGQIRLPVGLYAPYVGFFPKNTEGLFAGETANCILSTGLSASPGIPRINNLPQVVVVDLLPENEKEVLT